MIAKQFEDQVEKTPHDIAIKTGEITFTYEELNRYANRIARLILETLKSTKEAQRVSLLLDHGPDMIAAVLGVLKTGNAYVPLAVDYPDNRLSYMIANSQSSLILTRAKYETRARLLAQSDDKQCLSIDRAFEQTPAAAENPDIEIPGDRLAYIMYTSGSTGKPKGVMQNHENVLYYTRNWTRLFSITQRDRMTLFSSFCHDGSVQDMFGALLNGAALYPVNARDQQGGFELSGFLMQEKISIWHSVHSLFSYFAGSLSGKEEFPALRWILLGGEAMRTHEIDLFKKSFPHSMLANIYGQTESSVNSAWIIHPADSIKHLLIGAPLDRTRIFILDETGGEVDHYEVGEIMVACPHISPGYWQDEAATARVFSRDEELGPIYFTGDLGRVLPGGEVEFMGRRDAQVKLRGFRIELGEIESRLLKHSQVQEAAAAAKEIAASGAGGDGADKYLCAYIVAGPGRGGAAGGKQAPKQEPDSLDSEPPVDIQELKTFLTQELPDYMIPTYFVFLERLPLTQSGKIDRRALPLPKIGEGREYTAPRTPVEEKLAVIWSAVLCLEKEKIGTDADFFELGGHSLRGTAMLSKIHKEFNVQLPVARIFEISTIRGLAEYIRQAGKEVYIPIERAVEQEYYAVSAMQKRLFLLNEIEGIDTAYNLKSIMQVQGELDYKRLESVFRRLIDRHESLRTSFVLRDDEPVQRIHQAGAIEFSIEYYETSAGDAQRDVSISRQPAARDLQYVTGIIRDFIRPFDLAKAPLLRVGVILPNGAGSLILMIDAHHIIFDGVSMQIFWNEFMALYAGEELLPLKVQYKDYAQWLNSREKRESLKQQEEFWAIGFAEETPVLELPCDFKRPQVQAFTGDAVGFSLTPQETKALHDLALREGATLYMLLLAALNLLLAKLSGQEDIIVGTGIAGRNHEDVQGTIGIFVNTLAMRNYPEGDKRFLDFLQEVKEKTLQAYANQEYQFEDLVDRIKVKRDMSRNPIFDVMFVLQNMEFAKLESPDLKLIPYLYKRDAAIFDLNVQGYETNEELRFILSYCTALFKRETIEKFISYTREILASLIVDPGKKIGEVEIISAQEKKQILDEFNDTAVVYPMDKTIQRLFAEQAERTPDNIAAVGEKHLTVDEKENVSFSRSLYHITYRELNRQADRLSHLLTDAGVVVDDIIGVMLDRSLEMIIGLFGILKANAAYLPIEPAYPADRKKFLLEDSRAKLLLTTRLLGKTVEQFENLAVERVFVAEICSGASWNDAVDPLPGNRLPAHGLAYVIYTSGSTGKPKGVMIGHRSIVNRLNWMQRFYPIGTQDVILQKTTFVFDVSVWELFWWSFCGASLCLLEKGGEKDPALIIKAIERSRITTMHFVPSMLSVFLEYCERVKDLSVLSSLKQVFASGEALLPYQVEKFYKSINKISGCKLINLYGPTEAAVDVSYYNCIPGEKMDNIPIGKPIDNIRLYIFDKDLYLQPVGIVGELCIAGVGLARGYLNNPGLTAEKFVISHPSLVISSSKLPSNDQCPMTNDCLYKTGDLARWLPDGDIEFLGRIDHQVKIRGFRIELGEIENRLLQHEAITAAVVIAKEDEKKEKYLCAYIVTGALKVSPQELRGFLSQTLPDYMIPAYFVFLERLPLTQSGKIDSRVLPLPQISVGQEYTAPRTWIEEKLAAIWSDVLGVEKEKIGIDANFFDLGGHSLRGIAMLARVHRQFNVSAPIVKIFQIPTIRGLAVYIGEAVQDKYIPITPVAEKEYYAVTSIQERLFILNEIEGIGTAYNLRSVLCLEGKLDIKRLEKAFKKLIARHESLRTSFELREEKPVQIIHDTVDFGIEYHETPQAADRIIADFARHFDLSKAPLMRVGVIKTAAENYILLRDTHHIISDGTSQMILLREFLSLYEGKEMPPLRIQYKDYAAWRAAPQQQAILEKQEEYWLKLFSSGIPRLENFTDFPRPKVQEFAGDLISMDFDEDLTQRLNRLAREAEATLYMVLLAVYNILLFKYTGCRDILVGTPVAGREQPEVEDVVGLFINALVMYNSPAPDKTFAQFLEEVKMNTAAAFENQAYPFGDLMEKLEVKNDISRNPIYDVELIVQNMEIFLPTAEEILFKTYPHEVKAAQVDMALYVMEFGGTIFFRCIYSTGLFKRATMERFMTHFKEIVSQVLENRSTRLQDIVLSHDLEKVKADVYAEMAGNLEF